MSLKTFGDIETFFEFKVVPGHLRASARVMVILMIWTLEEEFSPSTSPST
jgi:hypothetical protein